MATERVILCGDVSESKLPLGGEPLRLRTWGRDSNIKLKINELGNAMECALPSAFVDLIEIATYVYCADQAVSRGSGNGEHFGSEWRRNFTFRIPVRRPDFWSSAAVTSILAQSLGFLSDDNYHFEFVEIVDAPSIQHYLFSAANAHADRIEEVALFSGGLDSLGGAIRAAIVDGRRIALVTHQSTSKLAKRYGALREKMLAKSKHPPMFIPISINKREDLSREYTQRSRSFLYMSLAATVAQTLGLDRIRFYENGVVSLNFSPVGQVVGAKATRTTHPRVLRGFSKLLSLVAERPFEVENPFIWKTKTEVVKEILSAGCGDMIALSTSCAHVWDSTNFTPHCGSCSQCIDRRFAILAAKAQDFESEDTYKVKLFVGERDLDEARTLLAAYVETATLVHQMSDVAFMSRFGEIGRVLSHLDEAADVGARRIFELQKRHAASVTEVVDSAIANHAGAIRSRSLPPTCLLRLIVDSAVVASPVAKMGGESESPLPPDQSLPLNYFRRKSNRAWEFRFMGGAPKILTTPRGAAYIFILLQNQGTPISVIKLASIVAGKREEFLLGTAGEATDRESLADYEARLADLSEQRDEASRTNDEGRLERIREEMATLADEVKKSKGIGGRIRRDADGRNRVRRAVFAAIQRTRDDIAQNDERFAAHLKPPTLRCGYNPCYQPVPPIDWNF